MHTQELAGTGFGAVQGSIVPGEKQYKRGPWTVAQLLVILYGFPYFFGVCCM